jgi:pimeloyl-ACP methyl ester carboxylesterase
MPTRPPVPGRNDAYAPFPLETDAVRLGLVTTTVSRPSGRVVARHGPERTGTRATLFLHGAAGSWTTWTPMLAAAAEAGIRISEPVLLDLPGWGDATPGRGEEPLTIDAVCELVRDLALELGYTEWDLVGHSLGGFIALHMAAVWPSSVRSVALVSATSYAVIESVGAPLRGLRDLPGFTLLLFFFRLMAPVQPLALVALRGIRRIGLLRVSSFPLFRHLSRIDASVIAALGVELRPRSFVTAAEVARGYDADASWARIRCPVVAMRGDKDVFVADDDYPRLARVVERFEYSVVADCGHFGNVERPAQTLSALGLAP